MKEIAVLKKYMIESIDLSKPVDYFFDLMNQEDIIPANQRAEDIFECHPELCIALDATAQFASDLLKRSVNLCQTRFCKIVQEKFYHGTCMLSDHPIPLLVLYFADIQLGIIALNIHGITNYFRFSLIEQQGIGTLH